MCSNNGKDGKHGLDIKVLFCCQIGTYVGRAEDDFGQFTLPLYTFTWSPMLPEGPLTLPEAEFLGAQRVRQGVIQSSFHW